MRLGEILAVRWKDVDLERKVLRVTATLSYVAGEITFPQPKTSRARRSVDLPGFVVTFLRRQRKEQNERRLFYGPTWTDYDVVLDDVAGAPFAPWSVSSDFRRITRELELPRTRFHDLRHAHATQAAGCRRPPEGRLRAARAQHRRVHDGRLLGRDPVTRAGGRRRSRPAVRVTLATTCPQERPSRIAGGPFALVRGCPRQESNLRPAV